MRPTTGTYEAMVSPVDSRQQVERVALASLADIRNYAIAHGVRMEVHRCRLVPWQYTEAPVVREQGVWGFAGKQRGWRFAVGAYCAGADKDLLALAIAHELGHCEQMTMAELSTDHRLMGTPTAWERCWHQEVDAWHRGLRIFGELGRRVTRRHADYAENCLDTYAAMTPVVGYGDDVWNLLEQGT
jgi:hypothetical protein